MRGYRASAVIVLLCAVPYTAIAQKVKALRKVELVTMGRAAAPAPAAADLAQIAGKQSVDTVLPETFRVHDLSRRYVEYRMEQEFVPAMAAGQTVTTGSAVLPEVAATSSIAVPGWMTGTFPALASASYAPGCTPIPYRPAGFLKADAEARRAAYFGMMSAIACEHGIPAGLFDAMIIQESRYNPVAVSSKRAFGLAQLMPGTAVQMGVNPYDPVQNLRGGARYLRAQLDRFGQVHLALAAYNAGPGRIRNGMVPRIAETQGYVATILGNWSRLNGSGSARSKVSFVAPGDGRSVSVSSY